MPRNMSFAMTTNQIKAQTKTVTRRFGWWFLKPGDVLCAVEKAMGLRKGEKVKRLAMLRVVSTGPERLNDITSEDVVREGFPGWTTGMFIKMLVDHYRVDYGETVNRIEFEYI